MIVFAMPPAWASRDRESRRTSDGFLPLESKGSRRLAGLCGNYMGARTVAAPWSLGAGIRYFFGPWCRAGRVCGVAATPRGPTPTGIIATTVFVAVSITETAFANWSAT